MFMFFDTIKSQFSSTNINLIFIKKNICNINMSKRYKSKANNINTIRKTRKIRKSKKEKVEEE